MPAKLNIFHSDHPKLKKQQVGQSADLNQGHPALGIRRTTMPLSARDMAANIEPKISSVIKTTVIQIGVSLRAHAMYKFHQTHWPASISFGLPHPYSGE